MMCIWKYLQSTNISEMVNNHNIEAVLSLEIWNAFWKFTGKSLSINRNFLGNSNFH